METKPYIMVMLCPAVVYALVIVGTGLASYSPDAHVNICIPPKAYHGHSLMVMITGQGLVAVCVVAVYVAASLHIIKTSWCTLH